MCCERTGLLSFSVTFVFFALFNFVDFFLLLLYFLNIVCKSGKLRFYPSEVSLVQVLGRVVRSPINTNQSRVNCKQNSLLTRISANLASLPLLSVMHLVWLTDVYLVFGYYSVVKLRCRVCFCFQYFYFVYLLFMLVIFKNLFWSSNEGNCPCDIAHSVSRSIYYR